MSPLSYLESAPAVAAAISVLGAIAAALLTWLGQRSLSSLRARQEQELEKTRAALQRELEKTKSELHKEAELVKTAATFQSAVLQSRHMRFIERQFEMVVASAALLGRTWLACRNAIQPDESGRQRPPPLARLETAASALDEFFADFEQVRILLRPETATRAYDFMYQVQRALDELRGHANSTLPEAARYERLFSEWHTNLRPALLGARELLEAEYRQLLGIDAA